MKKFKKPKEKRCALCGLPFMANSPWSMYCSDQCRKEVRKSYIEMEPPRECEYCGLMFQPNTSNQKYCTPECGWKGYRKTHKTCKQCGKMFETTSKISFCSDECCETYYSVAAEKVRDKEADVMHNAFYRDRPEDVLLAEIEACEQFRDAINDYEITKKW